MIEKPTKPDDTSKAREAIGRVLAAGATASDATRRTWRGLASGCLTLWLAIMGFGLVMSSAPWLGKMVGLILIAGIFALIRMTHRGASDR